MADLSRTLLPETICELRDLRRSGVLVVTHGETSKGLFFRAGQLVFASSTETRDKLGEHLVRLGRVSRAEFLAALQVTQGKRRVGRLLVDAGILSDEDLGRAVALQVQKIALSLFTWTEGHSRFHEAADPIPADLAIELSTSRLIFEGARLSPDLGRLERALPSARQTLRLVTQPPFSLTSVSFTPAERAVIEGAADGSTLGEVLAGRHGRPLLVRAAYALLAGGLVEAAGEAPLDLATATAAEVAEVDTGTFRLALDETPPAVSAPAPSPQDLAARILQLYEALPRSSHYEVLGVPADATRAQVEAAHAAAVREQDVVWGPLGSDVRLASLIGTLRLRRRQAYQVLSDPDRRAAYDRSLSRPEPPREAPVKVEERHQAGQLVRQAEELLREGKRDLAIALLLEVVRVDPHDHAARRLLAVSLAAHPEMHRTAERHFQVALEADPGDAELRFELAAYYRRVGLPRRAMAEARRVLSLAPDHSRALRLLRRLEGEGV